MTSLKIENNFGSHPFDKTPSNEWYLPADDDTPRLTVRDQFLASASADPNLEYGRLFEIPYSELESRYWGLLNTAIETNDEVGYEQTALKLAELYRHKEVRRQLGNAAMHGTEGYQRATRMSAEIFGEVDTADFAVVLNQTIDQALASALPEAHTVITSVNRIEFDSKTGEGFDFELTPEATDLLREDLFALFPNLEAALEPETGRTYTSADAVDVADRVIKSVDAMWEGGWRAELSDGSAATTAKADKRIKFGKNRTDFTSASNLNEVVIHEVLGHGLRAHRAQQQPEEALRHNLPGNTDFEEGLATSLQSLLSGRTAVAGQGYLLALGIGLGIDRGGQPRTFREMFDVLTAINMVSAERHGKTVDKIAAMEKAFQTCLRTRRGGTIDLRDISYFNGSKKAHKLLNDIARLDPQERRRQFELLFGGSFDATNPLQAAIFMKESTME